jgi:hypothetical protein
VETAYGSTDKEEDARDLVLALQCPDFAPPSIVGQVGKVLFGEAKWRKMRVDVRRQLAHLQPFLGGVLGSLVGVVLTIGLLLMLHLDLRSDPQLNGTALGYVVALALWGSALLYGFAGYSLFRFLAPKWQRAFEKRVDEEALAKPAREIWGDLYYCARDDVVFLPGQKHFARPFAIKEYCLTTADRQRDLVVEGYTVDHGTRSR